MLDHLYSPFPKNFPCIVGATPVDVLFEGTAYFIGALASFASNSSRSTFCFDIHASKLAESLARRSAVQLMAAGGGARGGPFSAVLSVIKFYFQDPA